MKPLVPASYAQFGVGAEWEARNPALADLGRSPMAWGSRPCFRGDLFLCIGVLPFCGISTDVQLRVGTCNAVLPGLRAVNAVYRVACLAWVWRIGEHWVCSPAREPLRSLLETLSAKEAMERFDCSGNHLGCRHWADEGLQCGLSGSRVSRRGNAVIQHLRGNHLIGDERRAVGKSNPYLSRKIYSQCCPVQFLTLIAGVSPVF